MLVTFYSNAALANEARAGGESAEREVAQLDAAHASAILSGNVGALRRLMAPDLVVNHPTGRIVDETEGIIAMIGTGVIRYTAFERHPERFIVHSDMVVVMGRETVVPARGAPNAGKTLERRYTNVWMRHDGQWQLAIRHANNVCGD
jgi:ketosteroid isomerase-like protein